MKAERIQFILLSSVIFSLPVFAGDMVDSREGSGEAAVGIGLGRIRFTSWETSADQISGIFHAHLGSQGFHFVVEIYPQPVSNPEIDESFTAYNFLFSFRLISIKSVYLKPAFGMQHRIWSGRGKRKNSDTGIAAGFSVGYPFTVGPDFLFAPELTYRGSSMSDDLENNFWGLQGIFSWNF